MKQTQIPKIFQTGNTVKVFQLESDGMRQMLRDFKPKTFEDLIILISMYRPGPMQYLDDVIAVKNEGKKEKASKIKDILVIILALLFLF